MVVSTKPARYERADLELEVDQRALTQPGCCRYVPVVVRLCGVHISQKVRVSVTFDRVRKRNQDGVPLDAYEVHPTMPPRPRNPFPSYYEYEVELLARAGENETGTIRVLMTSPSGTILSQATYYLDSSQPMPVQRECRGFRAVRCLSALRTREERDALGGQYPALWGGSATPTPEEAHPAQSGAVLHMASLFPEQ